ncbi:FCGR3 protein, partial [Scytalopus superciliaris]|nr:FCGR3 protein [Scytalopus superciliaris]
GPPCPTDRLVLQVPAQSLLEGDTVTLRCRGHWNKLVTEVRFYYEKKDLRGIGGAELSLPPLQLNHSGRYSCGGRVGFGTSVEESQPVTVTVH